MAPFTRSARRPQATQRRSAAACAAALCLLGLAQASTAATRDEAVGRALGHVAAQATRTLHGPGHSYAVRDVVIDSDGSEHVRMDRYVAGLRVIGGDLVVHSGRGGGFAAASMTLKRDPPSSRGAALGSADALRVALAARPGYKATGAEAVFYARGEQPTRAYDVSLAGTQDDGTPSELHVIVDAQSGQVLEQWDDIHTAPAPGTGRGYFSGTVALTVNSVTGGYELRDPSRGNQATVDMNNRTNGSGSIFKSSSTTFGDGTLATRATVGADAQYGTSVTWDYYLTVHGRNGIANNGVGANNRVHYSRNYNNAFWSDTCFCMTYGDGDGTTYNPFDSLDVAGHEMTHGVTSRTANLTYSGESGGLNEASSDIFGTAVEFFANNANDPGDYLIGERLYKSNPSGTKALRNMVNPSSDTRSADCWYSTLGSLDVHYSSGVANHFFYLLAEGTVAGSPSKTCQAGDTRVATGAGTVAAIGRAKAEKIWYRALTVYMTSATNYAGARAATLSAAGDLYGAGSPEVNAVAAAWTAVGRN